MAELPQSHSEKLASGSQTTPTLSPCEKLCERDEFCWYTETSVPSAKQCPRANPSNGPRLRFSPCLRGSGFDSWETNQTPPLYPLMSRRRALSRRSLITPEIIATINPIPKISVPITLTCGGVPSRVEP